MGEWSPGESAEGRRGRLELFRMMHENIQGLLPLASAGLAGTDLNDDGEGVQALDVTRMHRCLLTCPRARPVPRKSTEAAQ
jgi:hypothetical protein